MYVGDSLDAPTGAIAGALAGAALQGRLTVYAGAGISAADPTRLPGAAGLAKLLYDFLSLSLSMDDVDEYDLLEVADHAAAEPGGIRLLKDAVLRVADLTGARFSYAHAVLGLLLCEGAVTVIETNYDDCIERAAHPERLSAAVTDSDRIDMQMGALLKAHGCATRPSTMLVTTDELLDPPLFASAELAARLSSGDVAFIGIGSPADYVKSSLDTFVEKVGMNLLTVVGPQMADWSSTQWPTVLEGLHADQRVALSADEFCDALLRGYLAELRMTLRNKVHQLQPEHPQRLGVESILVELEDRTSVWAMRWLRAIAWQFHVGRPVVTSSRAVQGLLALGCLVGEEDQLAVQSSGWIRLERATAPTRLTILVSEALPLGGEMAIEAYRRVADARTDDRVPSGADVVVVCCGHLGPLGPDEVPAHRGLRIEEVLLSAAATSPSAPDSIMDQPDPDHLIDSSGAGRVLLVTGEQVIEAA